MGKKTKGALIAPKIEVSKVVPVTPVTPPEPAAPVTPPAPAAPAIAAPPTPGTKGAGDRFTYLKDVDKGAPQMKQIGEILKVAGAKGMTRGELVAAMAGIVKTCQPLERILTYYTKPLCLGGFVKMEKGSAPATVAAEPTDEPTDESTEEHTAGGAPIAIGTPAELTDKEPDDEDEDED